MSRLEVLTRNDGPPPDELAPGVGLRVLASGSLGARGLTTALAGFRPGATLPYHRHPFSEVIVVLEGEPDVLVEGRRYRLKPFDAMHLPAGTVHAVSNGSGGAPALLHSSFASDTPTRELVSVAFAPSDRDEPDPAHPENLVRFAAAPVYELAPRAHFRDLFARRLGSRGICGGYGLFESGASLPCHYHGFDESITIVAGTAVCQVAGREYVVSNYDTACIPQGRPHRFLNRTDRPMAMVWVYAGDEPDRTVIDPGYCEGLLPLTTLGG
ncbi:MAG TPA: cupin domain-containing protein [Gemmataceae bacterium]|nr:cupin domain-containing protein [Gemmataceae bacterium]